MNRWLLILLAALFLTATVLACGKKEEAPQAKKPVTEKQVQQEAKQTLETLKAYTEQQKEAYQKQVADHITAMRKKLEELKGQVNKAAPEFKAKLEKELGEANKDLETLQKNLEDVKTATGKAWEEVKGSVNKTLEDWQKSHQSENPDK